jgi:DNA-binding Lrp family transcriptional regulator
MELIGGPPTSHKTDNKMSLAMCMSELKSIDYKILASLMKNAKISDRQLAKEIGVSQPTVTRRRALEKEVIDAYTAIPKWAELGVEIMAFPFIQGRDRAIKPGELQESIRISSEWFSREPNVVFAAAD